GPRDHLCLDDDKATVASEDMTLARYLSCTPTNTGLLNDCNNDGSVIIFTIFIAKSRVRPSAADLDKVGTGPPISYDLPTGDTTKVGRDSAQLPSGWNTGTLSPGQYAAVIGQGEPTHPADMTEKEWGIVVENNTLMHAYRIDFSTNTTSVARRPAFQLKRHPAETFVVSSNQGNADSTTAAPEFRVFDDSSVAVVEITNQAQLSAAENSFSSLSIQASASGGVFGFAAGGSGGFSTGQSQGTATSTGTFASMMRVSYMFPRVIVFLDGESLEPTEGCLASLKAIDVEADASKRDGLIQSFRDLYGSVFSSEIQLGGVLHSTKLASAVAASNVHEKMDKLKVAAGVNFSTPSGSSASVSFEHGQGSDSSKASASSSRHESLTWSAKGGDTLLCSNPLYWSSTVQNLYNWRVIERSYPRTLADMLRQMDGCEGYGAYLDFPETAQTQGQAGNFVFDDD
ncbi:hypothetical protein C8A00DRAFT_19271, partial [Chaetomidium leptoderma]